MAYQQKIHPAEKTRAMPHMPHEPLGSSVSEKGSAVQHPAVLQPSTPMIPPTKAKRGRNCFCRCFCVAVSLLAGLLILTGATAGILYLIFKPKLPHYSVDGLKISALRLNLDLTLYARFDVKVTANNPNEKIGIHYEEGSQLSVWYQNAMLCEGALPKFYQGHQNITKLDVDLTGQRTSGSTILTALQQQQQTGNIPLDLKINARIAVQLGKLKLRKVKILGDCALVVDSLSINSLISIKASNCHFRIKP